LLNAQQISKSFGATQVLTNVNLTLGSGERRALLGENGAGKSTLMKIIAGMVHPDSGDIEVHGAGVSGGVRAARAAGIRVVHQELSLVPTMSIAENALLGDTPGRLGVVDRKRLRERGQELVELVGLARDPSTRVERLPFAERQLVEIGRALLADAKILLLDEPTSALSPAEVVRLFALLAGLKGTGVIYVTHRLGEVYTLCESATVLRDGHLVDTYTLSDTSPDSIVKAMVGRQLDLLARRTPVAAPGETVLEARDLGGPGVSSATFSVRAGEVCGIGGFVGSGRTELLRLLCGLARPTSGEVRLNGKHVRLRSTGAALRRGIAYVPEERHAEGIALPLSSGANAIAPSLRSLSKFGVINHRAAGRLAKRILHDNDVRPDDPKVPIRALSGGNQQKIVVGRWVPLAPKVFLLDEPSRGVDVAARSEVHRLIDSLAKAGAAVLVVSSDLPELITVADRIVVMREGHTVGELSRDECTEEGVIGLATGQSAQAYMDVVEAR
jgi:ABC-type sugar transport system ATPase subunit